MSRISRRGALAVLAGGSASAALLALGLPRHVNAAPVGASSVEVTASALTFSDNGLYGAKRWGELSVIGGLKLSSTDPRFGGLSGLSISADGRKLLAVTDHGNWFTGTLESARGLPRGIVDAMIAPMLGPDGKPLSKTRRFDTESLCVAGGFAYVGIERVNEVLRFPIGRDGLAALGEPLQMPAGAKTLPSNLGLEAVAIVPSGPHAGSLVAISERSDEGGETPTKGFFVTGQRGMFTVARHDDFDITDMAFLPSGDLLLLERRFAWLSGLAMRIRHVDGRSLRPGAHLDGRVIISLAGDSPIDNMEGLAVHTDREGVVLTLVSDDNFSMLQKTVLLQFRLGPDAVQRAAG
jgi:hypothetical protein